MKKTILTYALFLFTITAFSQSKEYNKIETLLEKGKTVKAENYFRKNRSVFDRSSLKKLKNKLAEAYLKDGNTDKAIDYYKQAHNNMELTKLYFDIEDYKNACRYCETQLFEKEYDCVDLSKKCIEKGLINEAVNFAKKAGGSDYLAKYYYDKEQYDLVVEYCESYMKYGMLFLKNDLIDEAIACCKKNENWKTKYEYELKDEIDGYLDKNRLYKKAYIDFEIPPSIIIDKMVFNRESLTKILEVVLSKDIDEKRYIRKTLISTLLKYHRYNDIEKYILTFEDIEQKEYWDYVLFEAKTPRNYEQHMFFVSKISKEETSTDYKRFAMQKLLANYILSTVRGKYGYQYKDKLKTGATPEKLLNELYDSILPLLEYFGFKNDFSFFQEEQVLKLQSFFKDEVTLKIMKELNDYSNQN